MPDRRRDVIGHPHPRRDRAPTPTTRDCTAGKGLPEVALRPGYAPEESRLVPFAAAKRLTALDLAEVEPVMKAGRTPQHEVAGPLIEGAHVPALPAARAPDARLVPLLRVLVDQ